MMKKCTWKSDWFCGNEVSDYGKKNGYIDYGTLSKAFDCVLNNNIINVMPEYWEQENGFIDNTEEIEELEEQLEELELTEENLEEYNAITEQIEELRNEEDTREALQWYIVSSAGGNILTEYTNEIVFYNSELDITLWGVTHYGTSWDYVLTDIKIEKE